MSLAKAIRETARMRRDLQRLKPRRTAGILTNFTTTGTTRRPNSSSTNTDTSNSKTSVARYA